MARVWLALDDLQSRKLPEVCLVCGRPAVVRVVQRLTWRPRSLSAVLWLTTCLCPPLVVAAIIFSLIDTRSITVDWPTCRRHQHYWTRRNIWLYSPLWAIAIVSFIAAILITRDWASFESFPLLAFGVLISMVLWAFYLAVLRRFSLRVVDFTDRHVVLAGVSPRFARAIRQERFVDRQQPTPAWPVYDPYPRAAATQGIENRPRPTGE